MSGYSLSVKREDREAGLTPSICEKRCQIIPFLVFLESSSDRSRSPCAPRVMLFLDRSRPHGWANGCDLGSCCQNRVACCNPYAPVLSLRPLLEPCCLQRPRAEGSLHFVASHCSIAEWKCAATNIFPPATGTNRFGSYNTLSAASSSA